MYGIKKMEKFLCVARVPSWFPGDRVQILSHCALLKKKKSLRERQKERKRETRLSCVFAAVAGGILRQMKDSPPDGDHHELKSHQQQEIKVALFHFYAF